MGVYTPVSLPANGVPRDSKQAYFVPIMPIHLRCEPRDVAPIAIVVGDPGRARLAASLMQESTCYNENRGLLGYTGMFEGRRISVQTTGMGGPAAAIVLEELAMLGVQTVIRAGTCGAIAGNVGVLDLVVATGAIPLGGTGAQYLTGRPFAPVADLAVTNALVDASHQSRVNWHAGLIASHDAFYREDDALEFWRGFGVLAAEMEAAAIFTVALHRGLKAGCVCLVVDRVGEAGTWVDDATLTQGAARLLEVAFRAALSLAVA